MIFLLSFPRLLSSNTHHRPGLISTFCPLKLSSRSTTSLASVSSAAMDTPSRSAYQASPGHDQRIHMYKTYFGSTVALSTISAHQTSRGDLGPSCLSTKSSLEANSASNSGSVRGRARALTTPKSFPRSHLSPGTPSDPWSTPRFPFTPSNSGMIVPIENDQHTLDTDGRLNVSSPYASTHTRPHNYHHEWYNAAELVVGVHPGLTQLLYQQPLHPSHQLQGGCNSPYLRTIPTFGHIDLYPLESDRKTPQFLQTGAVQVDIVDVDPDPEVNEGCVGMTPSPTPGANELLSSTGLVDRTVSHQEPVVRQISGHNSPPEPIFNHCDHQRHFALRDITNKPDSNKAHASPHAYSLLSNLGAGNGLGMNASKSHGTKLKRTQKNSAVGKENRPEVILAARRR